MSDEPDAHRDEQLMWYLRQLEREVRLHPREAAEELEDPEAQQLWGEVKAGLERLLAQRPTD
jgi:hypothetical protein